MAVSGLKTNGGRWPFLLNNWSKESILFFLLLLFTYFVSKYLFPLTLAVCLSVYLFCIFVESLFVYLCLRPSVSFSVSNTLNGHIWWKWKMFGGKTAKCLKEKMSIVQSRSTTYWPLNQFTTPHSLTHFFHFQIHKFHSFAAHRKARTNLKLVVYFALQTKASHIIWLLKSPAFWCLPAFTRCMFCILTNFRVLHEPKIWLKLFPPALTQ